MHRAWSGGTLAEERVIGLKEGNKEGNGFLSRLSAKGSVIATGLAADYSQDMSADAKFQEQDVRSNSQ